MYLGVTVGSWRVTKHCNQINRKWDITNLFQLYLCITHWELIIEGYKNCAHWPLWTLLDRVSLWQWNNQVFAYGSSSVYHINNTQKSAFFSISFPLFLLILLFFLLFLLPHLLFPSLSCSVFPFRFFIILSLFSSIPFVFLYKNLLCQMYGIWKQMV